MKTTKQKQSGVALEIILGILLIADLALLAIKQSTQ